jgi:hypothetical protein
MNNSRGPSATAPIAWTPHDLPGNPQLTADRFDRLLLNEIRAPDLGDTRAKQAASGQRIEMTRKTVPYAIRVSLSEQRTESSRQRCRGHNRRQNARFETTGIHASRGVERRRHPGRPETLQRELRSLSRTERSQSEQRRNLRWLRQRYGEEMPQTFIFTARKGQQRHAKLERHHHECRVPKILAFLTSVQEPAP